MLDLHGPSRTWKCSSILTQPTLLREVTTQKQNPWQLCWSAAGETDITCGMASTSVRRASSTQPHSRQEPPPNFKSERGPSTELNRGRSSPDLIRWAKRGHQISSSVQNFIFRLARLGKVSSSNFLSRDHLNPPQYSQHRRAWLTVQHKQSANGNNMFSSSRMIFYVLLFLTCTLMKR